MKQRLLFGLSVAIISVFPISAQESDSAAVRVEKEPYVMPRNSVYYELWGGSTGAGVYYDARFRKDSPFGFRAGFAWYCEIYTDKGYSFFDPLAVGYELAVPFEVNYLLGPRNHKFEAALGCNMGYYKLRLKYSDVPTCGDSFFLRGVHLEDGPRSMFAYYVYANLGYRFISRRGFQLRAGANFATDFGGKHGLSKIPVFPYVSFGYAF